MTDWKNVLVFVTDDPRLYAKVVEYDESTATVEFFLSVAERETRQVSSRTLSHASLPKQTRVFVQSPEGGWRVGRMIDKYREQNGLFDYTIKFPNDDIVELSETDCFVRCLERHADPSDILGSLCIETEFFANHRRPALRRLRNLASAAQGLTGVISAAVELLPHQVATVRRIVTDRHVRYLLADEVGLGKTIEAGLIVRQLRLDNPHLNVAIYVPAVLVSQWRKELTYKCLLPPESYSLLSHSDLVGANVDENIDLLIVDEAHRLVGLENEPDGGLRARTLRELATRVPRLLLLSATPALGDETRLLALLNLLDPANYPLDDIDGFRKRVADRQPIGRLLLAMKPGAPAFSLRQQAERAKAMFPDDPMVIEDANRLLASGDDAAARDNATAALRDHIAATYRIHQRLIRARRVDVQQWTMRPRGPVWPSLRHVRYCFLEDSYGRSINDALDAWRSAVTDHVGDGLPGNITERWQQLCDAAWHGGLTLHGIVNGLSAVFEGEAQILRFLADIALGQAADFNRADAIAEIARVWSQELGFDAAGRPKKIVCFVTDSAFATNIAQSLKNALGERRVLRAPHHHREVDDGIAAFALSNHHSVLVCDRSSEEGLNLQFVHGILHVDMPMDASRIEQRIGRLDRFGRKIEGIEHRIVVPDDTEEAPWNSWLSLLANGLRVFSQSISDVQFRVEALQSIISQKLIIAGPSAVDELTVEIVAAIADEREKLDEQYVMEGISKLVESGDQLVRSIDESEDDEETIERDIGSWVGHLLMLGIVRVGERNAATFQFSWLEDTLIPAIPWKKVLTPSMHERWTWRRSKVSYGTGKPTMLLRPGAPLVEALERIALWDDRGISYATWRMEEKWPSPWRGFRLVWVIEPGLGGEGPVYARRANMENFRRASAFLPTITFEHVVDDAGQSVGDPAILTVLGRKYRTRHGGNDDCDINLGSRLDLLSKITDGANFNELVHRVKENSRQAVLRDPMIADALASAQLRCDRDVERTRRVLAVRSGLSVARPDLVEAPSVDEMSDLTLLQNAIANPVVRLDEIGFYLIAARPT